jgi:hypothetical protein
VASASAPANDDFANALALTGSVFEDPGAGIGFYSASTSSFNWNAGKEVGEPNHAGDLGGASTGTPAKAPSSTDLLAPETTISRYVLKSRPPVRVFKFRSSEPGSTFRCKLDRRPFTACGSSMRFKYLKPGGWHVLRVAAVDMAGNKDPTPAVARFWTPRRSPESKRSRGEQGQRSGSQGFGD